ncbi:MAG TPA: nucleoside hydrolase [Pirellulales bacterium]|jgi:purine nucleosidase|nr:nucleoside hydrolase [Pirellulales bacterium]
MARKVIIDTDPGIDDAVALTMALFDPTLEVVAVTATGGNVFPAQATRNVQIIVEQLDPPRWPRIGAAPEDNPLPIDGRVLHGQNGLGNIEFPFAGLANIHPAEKVLCDEVHAAPEEITIVCLGPLTNIGRAMQRDPDFTSLVGRLVVSGGAINSPGRVSPVADFNIFCDPLSARRVLKSAATKTMVPLDISSELNFTFDLLEQLPPETTRAGKFLRKILPFAFRAQRQALGQEHINLHDVAALIAVTNPELFETEGLAGDVETEGELTAGMVVFDRRRQSIREWRQNMDVALKADMTAMHDCVLRSLERAGKES